MEKPIEFFLIDSIGCIVNMEGITWLGNGRLLEHGMRARTGNLIPA